MRALRGIARLCGTAALLGSAPAWAQDADGDGWDVAQGDCDDGNADVNPGISVEECGDRLDNDCNGFLDDGCDFSVRQGSIQGGGGCSGNDQGPPPVQTTATAGLLVMPAWWRRRRRVAP
jgi:MYXO-CTERM domain-containing protein